MAFFSCFSLVEEIDIWWDSWMWMKGKEEREEIILSGTANFVGGRIQPGSGDVGIADSE